MKINIQSPCSENWQEMTFTEKGKFCKNCQKEVIDFSHMNSIQIHAYLSQHKGPLCGRIGKEQLDYYNNSQSEPIKSSGFKKWSLAAAALALLNNNAVASNFPKGLNPTLIEQTHSISNIDADISAPNKPPTETITIKGQIISLDEKEPLFGAIIEVANTTIKTTSDENGYFELSVPKSDKKIEINCYYIGYNRGEKEISSKKSMSNLMFRLKETDDKIMGGIF